MSHKVIVIGAGMYVCGKNTDGYGTILPALHEAYKLKNIDEAHIYCQSQSSKEFALKQNEKLNKLFKHDFKVEAFSNDERNLENLKDFNEYKSGVVCIPDHLHYQYTKLLLENNIHSMVVKPLTDTYETSKELADIAKERNLIGMVDFHKRYDEANNLIKDNISNGKIGKPLYAVINYSQRKVIPTEVFSSWVEKTNIFQYLGVHYVDLIHYFTDAKPKRVMAIGQSSWLKDKGINTYDSIQVMIEWQQGKHKFTSTHFTNWIDPNNTTAMSDQRIELIGEKGRINSNQKNRGLNIVTDNDHEEINPYFSRFYESNPSVDVQFKGYGNTVYQHFFDTVNGGKSVTINTPTFEQSLTSAIVIEAANNSLESNSDWITCNE